MRFRDFVYAFQRYADTKVGSDDELRASLSQAYNSLSGKSRKVQEDYARIYAQIFRQGQRNAERRLELKILKEVSEIILSAGGGVATEY